MELPHSDACFVRAYPAATTEAWVDGHVHAFAFFGRVPLSILYDNDRCLVSKMDRFFGKPAQQISADIKTHDIGRLHLEALQSLQARREERLLEITTEEGNA